jgi:uncharacterized membrane-anchored protein
MSAFIAASLRQRVLGFAIATSLLCSSVARATLEEARPVEAAALDDGAPAAAETGVPVEAEPNDGEASSEQERAFEQALALQQGKVVLGDGLAEMNVPPAFRYTGPAGAAKVLEAWGNPPGAETLGMLFPADTSPLADDSWGVVITYTQDGHVDDDDAKDLDFDELLSEMQRDTAESNAEREKAGFPSVRLIGWAEPPHYDSGAKKLYWAKELAFAGGEANTLNYAIRVLGRRGVLELNAVASMEQLPVIKREMQTVLGFVEFKPGNRYADFDPDVDEVAAYGLGALIAGKVAAKAGLFKGLVALLLAGKKFLVFGVIALGAMLKGVFGRLRGKAASSASK